MRSRLVKMTPMVSEYYLVRITKHSASLPWLIDTPPGVTDEHRWIVGLKRCYTLEMFWNIMATRIIGSRLFFRLSSKSSQPKIFYRSESQQNRKKGKGKRYWK